MELHVGPCQPRGNGLRIVNPGTLAFSGDLYEFSSCNCNLARALADRFIRPALAARQRMKDAGVDPAGPHPLWDAALRLSRRLGRRFIHLQPLSDEDFLKTVQPALRTKYSNALKNINSYHKSWLLIKPFVKVEKYTFNDKPDRIPRPIQPRSFEYRAFLGKYIKVISAKLKHCVLPGQQFPFVAKGAAPAKLASLFVKKWESFANPIAISLDLSKFDATIHPRLKNLENAAFKQMSDDPLFRKLLLSQEDAEQKVCIPLYQGGKRTGKYDKISIPSARCSGDPQTGDGNTVIMGNVCTTIFKGKIELFCNGDDTIVIVERDTLQRRMVEMEDFKVFGLDIKLEGIAYKLEEVFWCQSYLWKTSVGYTWIRDPRRVLNTLLANNEFTPKTFKSLIKQIAECERFANPEMPIIWNVCDWVVKNYNPTKKFKFRYSVDTIVRNQPYMDNKSFPPNGESRRQFETMFGINAIEQLSIENSIIQRLRAGSGPELPEDWICGHPISKLGRFWS